MTEFLHEVVAKRESQQTDPWSLVNAFESWQNWLLEQQREGENADI
jgi:hypothetical protein